MSLKEVRTGSEEEEEDDGEGKGLRRRGDGAEPRPAVYFVDAFRLAAQTIDSS